MQQISDDLLINKLKDEDNTSFELLYKFYFPSVANYIRQNAGNNTDAEDIFQESILVLLQKVRQPDFALSSSLKTYVYAIAKNLWLKRLRDNKLVTPHEDFDFDDMVDDASQANFDEPNQAATEEYKVKGWLGKITQRCQQILESIFFFNEPIENLMVKMGWKNKHTAANQKYKCIEQIKRESKK